MQHHAQASLPETILTAFQSSLKEIQSFKLLDQVSFDSISKRLSEVGGALLQQPETQALSQLTAVSSDLSKVIKLLADVAELREVISNPKANSLVQLDRETRVGVADGLHNVLAASINLARELVTGPSINDPYKNNHQDIAITRDALRNTIDYAKQPMDPIRSLALTQSIDNMDNLKAPSTASRLFKGALTILACAALTFFFPPTAIYTLPVIIKSLADMAKEATPAQQQAHQLQKSLKDYMLPPTPASTSSSVTKEEPKEPTEAPSARSRPN